MGSLLLSALLLTVLLWPALAVTPIMELTPPGSPLDSTMDEVSLVSDCCRKSFEECCWYLGEMQRMNAAPPVRLDNLIDAPSPKPPKSDINTEPVFANVNDAAPPPQRDRFTNPPPPERFEPDINTEPTTVRALTVQAHVDDTYTVGDRSGTSYTRQPRCENGFPCNEPGCKEVFNRQCDLNRHLDKNKRPYVCSICERRFRYPKDLQRHEDNVHSDSFSVINKFRCGHPDCTDHNGFKRQDNLRRHERKHQQQ